MKISEIKRLLNADVLCGDEQLEDEVNSAFGSDMMSDVLAFVQDRCILLTGLVNAQVIRTAEMMDMPCIVFVRGKRPSEDMIKLAREMNMVVLSSKRRMYDACGVLFVHGLNGNGDVL